MWKKVTRFIFLFVVSILEHPHERLAIYTSTEGKSNLLVLMSIQTPQQTADGITEPNRKSKADAWATGVITWPLKQAGLDLEFYLKHTKCFFPLSLLKIFIMDFCSPQACITDFQLPGNVEISLPSSQSSLYLQLQEVLISMMSRRKEYTLNSVASIEKRFSP